MLAFSIALLLSAPTADFSRQELFDPEAAVRRVWACGFTQVETKADDLLQETVVVVSGLSEASNEQLRCAAEASVVTGYFVEFPKSLDAQYQRLYVQTAHDRYDAEAREWLDRRGVLARLPRYIEGKSDRHAVELKIEELCGPKAKGQLTKDKMFPDDTNIPSIDDETFMCVFNAATVSGLPIGFVGNEYYPPKDEQKPRHR